MRSIEYLAAYATTYRYPSAEGRIKPAPTDDAVAAAMRKLTTALEAAAKAHDVDLSVRDTPAGSPRPLR